MTSSIRTTAPLIGVAFLLVTGGIGLQPAQANETTHFGYTPHQVEMCDPARVTNSDSAADTSNVGESVTSTAISVIRADDGRFLDLRPEAVAIRQGGLHMNRPGSLRVTLRINGIFPVAAELRSGAHRGTSGRWGRHARADNSISGYQVLLTPDCLSALGFFD